MNGNILDFSTTNSQETDFIINVANSNPISLGHAVFYNKAAKPIVISTGAGGTGTVLTETTDWTSGGAFPDASFPSTIAPDIGYTTVSIVNATYHSTDLYISYYPITDLFNADLWNNSNTLPSLGDYDISAGDTTEDLAIINSYPIGYKFRVSWYDGDGSNTFSFTDNSETIDGAGIAQYIGEGTGHLDLLKTGAGGEYITINRGEIWDSDGGNFTNQHFEKRLDGSLFQTRKIPETSYAITTGTGVLYNSAIQAAQNYPVTAAQLDITSITCMSSTLKSVFVGSSTTNATASAWQPFVLVYGGSAGSVSITVFMTMNGRWTTSYPRIT